MRATVSLLLLPLLLLQASQAVGGEIVLAPKARGPVGGTEKRFYYHANHLGSVNVVTDDRGAVISRRDYKPYGELFAWTGARSGPRELLHAFDGQRIDDKTGLYGFGVRQYDPELGRFLSADTQVPDPLDPRTLNRYAFAGGNPLQYVDPTGHSFWDVLLGVFVFLALAVLAVVSFGALAVLSSALAMAFAFTIGFAALGAAAFATVALARGLSPLSADFWISVGTGFVLGAVIGAGLCAMWGLTFGGVAAAAGFAGFIKGMCLSILVGAMFGAIEATAAHFASGGGPESLLLPMLISAGISAAIAAVTFGVVRGAASAGWITKAWKGVLTAAAFVLSVGKVVHAGFTGTTAGQSLLAGAEMMITTMLLSLLTFKASPARGVGVPAWAFSGTVIGRGGGDDREGLAPLLQTMPLAP